VLQISFKFVLHSEFLAKRFQSCWVGVDNALTPPADQMDVRAMF
jgi:hypothetical protein